MCEDAIVRMTVAASGTPLGAVFVSVGDGLASERYVTDAFYGDGATGVDADKAN